MVRPFAVNGATTLQRDTAVVKLPKSLSGAYFYPVCGQSELLLRLRQGRFLARQAKNRIVTDVILMSCDSSIMAKSEGNLICAPLS